LAGYQEDQTALYRSPAKSTLNVCETGAAAAYVLLPACEAWTVQTPGFIGITVLPETPQTAGVEEL
jgi:hypothetical protein